VAGLRSLFVHSLSTVLNVLALLRRHLAKCFSDSARSPVIL